MEEETNMALAQPQVVVAVGPVNNVCGRHVRSCCWAFAVVALVLGVLNLLEVIFVHPLLSLLVLLYLPLAAVSVATVLLVERLPRLLLLGLATTAVWALVALLTLVLAIVEIALGLLFLNGALNRLATYRATALIAVGAVSLLVKVSLCAAGTFTFHRFYRFCQSQQQ